MKKAPNPHDTFFKRIFSRLDVAAEFLRHYLPADVVSMLDLNRLTLEKDSFADARLRQHFSDLLFRVGLKGGGEAFIFILLEHKSASEEWVALQLLRYMTLAWEQLRRGGCERLPLIIPVVCYHGPAPWRVSTHLRDLFEPYAQARQLRRYLPDFTYYLCDLSQLDDEDLVGAAGLPAVLRLLKYILRRGLPEQLPEIFRESIESLPEPELSERVETMVRYVIETERATEQEIAAALIAADTSGANMETFFDRARKEGRSIGLTEGLQKGLQKGLQEGLQEGLQKGLQKGRREGAQAAAADLVLSQLSSRLGRIDADTKARIRLLSATRLTKLGVALLKFDTHADLDAWLRRQRISKATKSTNRMLR